MWPTSGILTEIVSLLREQNSLLRELVQAQTNHPASTPRVSNAKPLRKTPYTEKDVFLASVPNATHERERASAAVEAKPDGTPTSSPTTRS